jgi:hypothetical protein
MLSQSSFASFELGREGLRHLHAELDQADRTPRERPIA